jgi:hypothetical protein
LLPKARRRHGVPETSTLDGSDAQAAAIKSDHQAQGTALALRQGTLSPPSWHPTIEQSTGSPVPWEGANPWTPLRQRSAASTSCP